MDLLARDCAPLPIRRNRNISYRKRTADKNLVHRVGGQRVLRDRAIFGAYNKEVVPGCYSKMVLSGDIYNSWLVC